MVATTSLVTGLLALLPRLTAGAASAGCSRLAVQRQAGVGVLLNQTLDNRRYLQFIPSTYSPSTPAPVILSYHGGSRTADDQLKLDQLTNPFFNDKYIIIYPYGINVSRCPSPSPLPSPLSPPIIPYWRRD